MRIAIMHRRLRGGGTEADLRQLATSLARRGHEVHVFCARSDARLPGVQLRHVPVLAAGRLVRVLSFALAAPRMVGQNSAAGLFVMEYLDPAMYPVWKDQLREGQLGLLAARERARVLEGDRAMQAEHAEQRAQLLHRRR